MVYRNVKTIKQNLFDSLIWRICFLHLATGFNIIYPCLLKYSQGKVGSRKNTDACRRHAMDLHSIIYNSAVQF